MGIFEPVIIEPEGGCYLVQQSGATLFRIPKAIFESFEADCVFPAGWSAKEADAPGGARSLLWHPSSGELLMGAGGDAPHKLAEIYGNHPFRSYLHAYWVASKAQLLLSTYWFPEDPSEEFSSEARKLSVKVQHSFLELVGKLRPPNKWRATFNAVERYRRVVGLVAPGEGEEEDFDELEELQRLYLAPPAPLHMEGVGEATAEIILEMVGEAFATLDSHGRLMGVEAFTEEALNKVRTLFTELGIEYVHEAFVAH